MSLFGDKERREYLESVKDYWDYYSTMSGIIVFCYAPS